MRDTLAERLQRSIDDVSRICARHARDSKVYDDAMTLYRKLLAHKARVEKSAASQRDRKNHGD